MSVDKASPNDDLSTPIDGVAVDYDPPADAPPRLSRVAEARAKFSGQATVDQRQGSSSSSNPTRSRVNDFRQSFELKQSQEFERSNEKPSATKANAAAKKLNGWRRSSRLLTPTHSRAGSLDDAPSGGIVDVSSRSQGGSRVKGEDHIVNIQCLAARDLGKFRLSPATTFAELRTEIARKLGHTNFTFQDRETKRQWTTEDIPIMSVKAPILVSQSGLDNLLADSTFQDKSNSTLLPDGTTAFKFASVRGSDKGFQFVKGRMASRFFATSVEQKNTLSIFFCFVWRPNAVRRGWLPPLEDPLANEAVDATDPRMFSALLRRHLVEVDQIVKDIEKSMDPRTVRAYIKMFVQMFSGGYSMNGAGGLEAGPGIIDRSLGDKQLSALGVLRDKLGLDHDALAENGADGQKKIDTGRGAAAGGKDLKGELFELSANDDTVAPVSDPSGAPPPPPPGGIPPPPCPPGGPLIQKPPICPVNFEGISAHDIPGTIWADMASLNMKPEQQEKLTNQLTIIFGRDARERSLLQEEDEEVGVLEAGRLRNLEVLLNMEELKGLTFSAIVDMILDFDERLFNPSVLERLARRSTKEGGVQYAFLPTQKEAEALITYAEQNGDDSLRPGEVFFLELALRVPDRIQRFEYGSFMAKFDMEIPGLESELVLLQTADKAVRNSERFKRALKVILDILTTLMPRFGLTRGFRISSFLPSTERVNGTVANPAEGRVSAEDAIAAIEASVDPTLPDKERKKQIKLAMMRKKVQTQKEKDFWAVKLQEFISCYTNRFEACSGFWEDLEDPCDAAMRVDQAALDQQTGEWILQFEELKEYHELVKSQGSSGGSGGAFIAKIGSFLQSRGPDVTRIRAAVISARKKTEELWKWLGEVMGGDPSLIFKHVHDFAQAFAKHWKALEASWDNRKTMVLRGALTLEKYVPPPKDEATEAKKKQAAGGGATRTMRSNSRAAPAGSLRPKKSSAVSAMAAAIAERRDVDSEEILAGSTTSDSNQTESSSSANSSFGEAAEPVPVITTSSLMSPPPPPPPGGLDVLSQSHSDSSSSSVTPRDSAPSAYAMSNSFAISPDGSPSSSSSLPPTSPRDSPSGPSVSKNPGKFDDDAASSSSSSTTDSTSRRKKWGRSSKSSKSKASKVEPADMDLDDEMPPGMRPRSTSTGDARPPVVHPAKYPIPGKESADDSSPVVARKKPKSKLKKIMKLKF